MGSLQVRFLKTFFRAFGQARHLINCLNRLFQSLINCWGYQLKHVFRVYLYFSPSPRSRQQQYLLDLSLHQALPMSNDINEDLIRIQEDRNGSWYWEAESKSALQENFIKMLSSFFLNCLLNKSWRHFIHLYSLSLLKSKTLKVI